jgi:exopolysaccharide biosynthesis polyprenyl glycosylphosphotransferase
MEKRTLNPKFILLAGDAVFVFLSLSLAHEIRARLVSMPGGFFGHFTSKPGVFISVIAIYLFSFYVFDLYGRLTVASASRYRLSFYGAILLSTFLIVFQFWLMPYRFGRGVFFLNVILVSVSVGSWRYFMFSRLRRFLPARFLLVIARPQEREVIEKLLDPGHEDKIIGYIPLDDSGTSVAESAVTGSKAVLEAGAVNLVVVSLSGVFPPALDELILRARQMDIPVLDFPAFYEQLLEKIPVGHINERWIFQSRGFRNLENELYRRIKRALDVFVSLVVLVVTAPLSLLLGLLIKLTSKGPVFYVQDRLGEGEKTYRLRKFRTMVADAEKGGPRWAEEKDLRVTAVGRVLRKTRLDELPQFTNVLKGDMSLVGPRPEREFFVRQLEKEIPAYALRFLAKPGITGWAQIYYPYGASVEDAREKLRYDLYYIKNFSLGLDLKILLKTFRVMFFGAGR